MRLIPQKMRIVSPTKIASIETSCINGLLIKDILININGIENKLATITGIKAMIKNNNITHGK